MNIKLILVGKTNEDYLNIAINKYVKRLKFYVNFDIITISELRNIKNTNVEQQKEKEGKLILSKVNNYPGHIILLDEKGKEFTSEKFASWIHKKQINSTKNLIFIIGGPFGFSNEIYSLANEKISLSQMTFSHQMIRLLFVEQIYRAYTIINNEPYHHK